MSFGHPLLLLTLAVIPAALAIYHFASRRRMRYAVRYTNVDVLAAVVAAGRPWRRWLAAGVFTRDISLALRAFDELKVGGVMINQVPTFRLENMPYGGVKDSGQGREGVRFAMEEMTELRTLVIKTE